MKKVIRRSALFVSLGLVYSFAWLLGVELSGKTTGQRQRPTKVDKMNETGVTGRSVLQDRHQNTQRQSTSKEGFYLPLKMFNRLRLDAVDENGRLTDSLVEALGMSREERRRTQMLIDETFNDIKALELDLAKYNQKDNGELSEIRIPAFPASDLRARFTAGVNSILGNERAQRLLANSDGLMIEYFGSFGEVERIFEFSSVNMEGEEWINVDQTRGVREGEKKPERGWEGLTKDAPERYKHLFRIRQHKEE